MYTLEDPRSVSLHPVEGMRENWSEALIRNYDAIRDDDELRKGFLLALNILSNSFLPHAYLRAEPIARFEMILNKTLFDIKHPKLASELNNVEA